MGTIIKKLFFSLPFLLTFLAFTDKLNLYLSNSNLVLDLSSAVLINSLLMLTFLLASSFFFVVFVTLAHDYKLILPVILITSLSPLVSQINNYNFLLAGGSLITFFITAILLDKKLTNYLTFQPANLLLPSLKQVVILVLLISSLILFQASKTEIGLHGFQIPESWIDLSVKISSNLQNSMNPEVSITEQFQISPEEINQLRQKPELLKQYGLDPSMLDLLGKQDTSGKTSSTAIVNDPELRENLKKTFQSFIRPYVSFIPVIVALLFFISFSSTGSLLSILFLPIMWFIFKIMEKTGYINFQVEMREVKKLVV